MRDARAWSRYLNEAIRLFADRIDVVFASHHWPTWGREEFVLFLTQQRDLYAYLHDQTLRLLNQGLTGAEIAEELDGNLPPALDAAWHTQTTPKRVSCRPTPAVAYVGRSRCAQCQAR